MDHSATTLKIDSGGGAEAIREAAAIWSEATALRDGTLTARKVEELIPGVRRRLSLDEAELLVARSSGHAAGFTLYAPHQDTLEIFYLAVRPDAWGRGVASQLLREVEKRAREMDRRILELWVIDDNARAIRVYEKNGFVRTDDTKYDSSSTRTERRLLKQLSCAPYSITGGQNLADAGGNRECESDHPHSVGSHSHCCGDDSCRPVCLRADQHRTE